MSKNYTNSNFQEKQMKRAEFNSNKEYQVKQAQIGEGGALKKYLRQQQKLAAKQRRDFINRLGS